MQHHFLNCNSFWFQLQKELKWILFNHFIHLFVIYFFNKNVNVNFKRQQLSDSICLLSAWMAVFIYYTTYKYSNDFFKCANHKKQLSHLGTCISEVWENTEHVIWQRIVFAFVFTVFACVKCSEQAGLLLIVMAAPWGICRRRALLRPSVVRDNRTQDKGMLEALSAHFKHRSTCMSHLSAHSLLFSVLLILAPLS